MLERYADGRRIQAASLVALGAAVPPALPLGFGAAALTTLRRGPVDGAVVVGLGYGFLAVVLAVTGGVVASLLPIAIATALVVSLADILRRSGSLSLALQGGMLAGLALLGLALIVAGDQEAYWRGLVEQMLVEMERRGSAFPPDQREAFMASMPFAAMSGLALGVMMLIVWIGLFLGRSWQARLVNPGGFSVEFRGLRLGRTLALGSAAVFFGNAVIGQAWLLNVSAFLIQVWLVQGLAYLHWTVARGEPARRSLWLVVTYTLLGLFWLTGNPLAIIVPLVGMVGEIVDFRRLVEQRFGSSTDK